MLKLFDPIRDIRFLSVLARLFFAIICGGVIGLERSYKNRPAGFRTHILICVGATVASMTGLYLYLSANLPTDISRIGAQVVSGLGFIGAGTIIVTNRNTIKGLTTAAGLWACGIIGLAIGAGYYEGAVCATLLILFTETVLSNLTAKIKQSPEFAIEVSYHNKASLDQVMRWCKNNRLAITNLRITSSEAVDVPLYHATISLRARKPIKHSTVVREILGVPGILNVEEI